MAAKGKSPLESRKPIDNNVLVQYIPPYTQEVETIYRRHILERVFHIFDDTNAQLKTEKCPKAQAWNMYFKSESMKPVNIVAFLPEIEEYDKYKEKNPNVDVGLWLEKKYEIFVSNQKTPSPNIQDLPNLDNRVEETIKKRKSLRYYCLICDKILIDHLYQYYQHFGTQLHIASQNKLNLKPSAVLQETTCHECQLMTYSTVQTESHKHGFSFSDKNILPIAAQLLLLKRGHMKAKYKEIVSAADKVTNMGADNSVILKDLSHAMRDLPTFRAYLFGSAKSGLASLYSDLDIYFDLGNQYFGENNQDADTQAEYVDKAKSRLDLCRKVWTNTTSIRHARTPIVKTFHIPTCMRCDISFRNGLAVENTNFIIDMIHLTPNLRGLILMLRFWLSRAKMLDNFSNYALTIMALFFMQVHKFLPSLSDLRSRSQSYVPKMVAGWDCQYQQVTQPPRLCTLSLHELMSSFFAYYGKFNYETQVICPLLGRPIEKEAFENDGATLPIEMEQYQRRVAAILLQVREDPQHRISHPEKELFSHSSAMCVQDPFDLTHNLTGRIRQDNLSKFQEYCKQSAILCHRALSDT